MPYPAYRIVPHCRPGKRRAPGRKKCGGFLYVMPDGGDALSGLQIVPRCRPGKRSATGRNVIQDSTASGRFLNLSD
ncbi:hypothetical protein AN2353V1_2982 [Citrobacter koseri]|nr:hypothetical protein AN2353V1_2982 [Citrobacter koseri]CAH6116321.1 hypothetical protein AN2353V1_2982 [Citrobacter koseri]